MKSFNQFLFEVEFKHVRDIEFDVNDLPFQDIFGTATRIVQPLKTYDYDIEEKLKELGYTVDWENKTASKEILTQRGYKTTTVGLGKVIEKLGTNAKAWWAKVGSDYSVVLSRHPIDILRMSDHSGIQSCHSPNGSYFHCAIDEAESGGPVAFLVKRKDIESLDKEKISGEEEIFYDKDRHIPGIRPISRLRIRRYQNKEDDSDLAIPEIRVYGNDIPGFYETVLKMVRNSQEVKGRPNLQDFIRVGGSYQDTPDGELFNAFFNDKADNPSDNTTFNDEDDPYNQDNQLRQEMDEILIDYLDQLTHFDLSYHDYDEGDGLNFLFSCTFTVKLDHPLKSTPSKSDLKELIQELNRNHRINLTINEDFHNPLQFIFDVDIDDFGGPDDFRHYCAKLKGDYEDNYDEIKKDIYNWLIREGFVDSHFINFTDYLQKQNVPDHDSKRDVVPEDEWQELKDLNHFSWSQDFSQINISNEPEFIGMSSDSYTKGYSNIAFILNPYHIKSMEHYIKQNIIKYARNQMTRWRNIPNLPGMTSRYPAITRLVETDFDISISSDKKNFYMNINLSIPYNANLRDIGEKIRLVKVMDSNYKMILDIARSTFDHLAKNDVLSMKDKYNNPITPNLSKLGKI